MNIKNLMNKKKNNFAKKFAILGTIMVPITVPLLNMIELGKINNDLLVKIHSFIPVCIEVCLGILVLLIINSRRKENA